MYTSLILSVLIICETIVIICVYLPASQLVSSLTTVVPVSLPRLASTVAGAVNSKGKEKDFFFFDMYMQLCSKDIQKNFQLLTQHREMLYLGFTFIHIHTDRPYLQSLATQHCPISLHPEEKI